MSRQDVGTRVGFVGLGNIGEPMARNVARGGHELAVLDLEEAPMARLADDGARRAISLTDLATRCDVVRVVVIDQEQVEQVMLGENGVLAAMSPGSVVVVHSTLSPPGCERLALLAAEQGIGFLDAPVSGGPTAAEQGTLCLMVGGAAAHLAAARPVLASMGRHIFHVGGVGRGQVAKIANNMALAATMQAVHEALMLATAFDVQPPMMLDILRSGAGNSWVAENWDGIGTSVRNYPGGVSGLTALTLKDLGFGLDLAVGRGLRLPFTELTARKLDEPYLAASSHVTGRKEPA